jgi:MYXO-CTERM domain-containing protein
MRSNWGLPPESGPRAATLALACLVAAAALPAAAAQSCSEGGHNVQCSELGSIRMESVREIKGTPIQVTSEVTLNSNFQEHGARWFLFSVRNVTADGTNPVLIKVDSFTADGANVVTTKTEQKPYEDDYWVAVEDVPVGKTIQIAMTVGATDSGAFQLETLVMAFDRGYAAVTDSTGAQASLFSFTLLGVKTPTASLGAGPLSHGYTVPGVEVPAAVGVLALAVAAARRRRA